MSQVIGVIGTGYVGLVTGTCLAEVGNTVIAVDVNAEKVDTLRRGIVPIYEPGLDILLERNLREGRISFSTDIASLVENSDVIMLCLPTPSGKGGEADLSYVMDVTRDITSILKEKNIAAPKILVNKSTVPVGTADLMTEYIMKEAPDFDVTVVSNPEFLSEGFAVNDFMKPDRIVIGTSNARAKAAMSKIYDPFVRAGAILISVDVRSSEVIKYAANAMLAVRISFINELARFCEISGADIDYVRQGVSADPRIGKNFLFAGVGYGGSCLPKDVRSITHTARLLDSPLTILEAVERVNITQRDWFLSKVFKRLGKDLSGRKIGIWGLAFKPNTDDMREAPSVYVTRELLSAGAEVWAYDPEAVKSAKAVIGDAIFYGETMYEVLDGADALVILTEWGEFRNPNWHQLRARMRSLIVFDGRNLYHPSDIESLGIEYYGVGRNFGAGKTEVDL